MEYDSSIPDVHPVSLIGGKAPLPPVGDMAANANANLRGLAWGPEFSAPVEGMVFSPNSSIEYSVRR